MAMFEDAGAMTTVHRITENDSVGISGEILITGVTGAKCAEVAVNKTVVFLTTTLHC